MAKEKERREENNQKKKKKKRVGGERVDSRTKRGKTEKSVQP